MAKDKITLLLDSGAFSAWKNKTTVDLKAYIRFIKAHEKRLHAYVSLDVIPGTPKRGREDPELAAKASDRNLQIMLDAGTKPIPVYHQYENLKWLVKMVNDGHDYIGISPNDRQPTASRKRWLDEVYTLLCDSKGRPCVRTHGFGVTSLPIMSVYPFFTADSTTWFMMGGHGRIQLPAMNPDGSVDFSRQVLLTVSSKSTTTTSPRQLIGMDKQAALVERYIGEMGYTREDIETSYIVRTNIGLKAAADLVAFLGKSPARIPRERVRTWLPTMAPPAIDAPLKALPPFKMKLFHVAWADKAHSILTQAGMMNRLISYFHIQDWDDEALDSFMTTGLIGGNYTPRKTNGPKSLTRSTKTRGARARARRLAASASSSLVRPRDRERV